MKRYLLYWFVLLVLAFTNGALRELTYNTAVGNPWANYISVLTGIIILGIAIWYSVKRWGFASQQQAVKVGIVWVVLTEIFEFAIILSNPKHSFDDVVNAHNMAAGEMWIVMLLWIGAAPVLFYRLRLKK